MFRKKEDLLIKQMEPLKLETYPKIKYNSKYPFAHWKPRDILTTFVHHTTCHEARQSTVFKGFIQDVKDKVPR